MEAGAPAIDGVAWSSSTGRREELLDESEDSGFVIEPGCSDADG